VFSFGTCARTKKECATGGVGRQAGGGRSRNRRISGLSGRRWDGGGRSFGDAYEDRVVAPRAWSRAVRAQEPARRVQSGGFARGAQGRAGPARRDPADARPWDAVLARSGGGRRTRTARAQRRAGDRGRRAEPHPSRARDTERSAI